MLEEYNMDRHLFKKRAILFISQPITFAWNNDRFNAIKDLAQKCRQAKIPIIVCEYYFDEMQLQMFGVGDNYKKSQEITRLADYVIKLPVHTYNRDEPVVEDALLYKSVKKDKFEFLDSFKAPPAKSVEERSKNYFKTVGNVILKIFELQNEKDQAIFPVVIEDHHISRDFLMLVGGNAEHCQRNYVKYLQEDILARGLEALYADFKKGREKKVLPLKIIYFPGLSVAEREEAGKRVSNKDKARFLQLGKIGRRRIEQDLIVVEKYNKFIEEYIKG